MRAKSRLIEEVYLIEPLADKSGRSSAVLQNAQGTRGASMQWHTSQLPYLTIWKNTAAEADGYVTGIEPATGYPFNRRVERKFGRVPKLKPNQTRRFSVEISLLHGKQAVSEQINAVKAIQGNTQTKVINEPPSTD